MRAYVTFQRAEAAQIIVKMKNKITVFGQSCIAKPAPDPSDIIWENFNANRIKVTLRKVFLFAAICVIFLITVMLKQHAESMRINTSYYDNNTDLLSCSTLQMQYSEIALERMAADDFAKSLTQHNNKKASPFT